MTTPRPAQSPAEPPHGGWCLPGPGKVCGALLRRHAVRALLATTRALRGAADHLTRLRWRLEDLDTARHRAVTRNAAAQARAARHPTALPRLTVVPTGIAQGRADLQFTHRAGHGASQGDPDL